MFIAGGFTAIGAKQSKSKDSAIFRDVTINLVFLETPMIEVQNYPVLSWKYKWMVAQVDYAPIRNMLTRNSSKYQWMDDVEVEMQIIIPSEYQGKGILAVLSGNFKLWGVPLDGVKHQVSGYVPPQIVRRYSRSDAKMETSYLLKNVIAKVSFYSKDRRLLGEAYTDNKKFSARKTMGIFQKVNSPIFSKLELKNVIYPRTKTPWAHIQFDYFDLPKQESGI